MNLKNIIESEIKNFLNEDFKSMKAQYLKQGIDSKIIDNYIDTFKTIKDFRELNDDIIDFKIDKDKRKIIDNYKDFHQLETIVDYVKGKRNIKNASFEEEDEEDETLEFPGNIVLKDDQLDIKYANSPRACIKYKGKFPYSWCISRTDASNMFSTYRFKENEPAFYFIKRIKATENEFGVWNMTKNVFNGSFKDKYHFFVVQVHKNAKLNNTTQQQYTVTSAQNDGDKLMSWNDILKFAPELNGKQELIKPIPLSPKEKETFNKYNSGISDEEFAKLDYKEKRNYLDVYVKMNKHITDNQFNALPDDLKNLYIGLGVPISKYMFDYVMSNGKLKKRYDDILSKRIGELIKGTAGIGFGVEEVSYSFQIGLLDGDKLNAQSVNILFKNASIEQKYNMVKQIISYVKDKLNSDIINSLLYKLSKEQKYDMIKQIFPYVKDKLDSSMINRLLNNTPQEQKYDMVKQIFPYVKDKLDSSMINRLLDNTPQEQKYDMVKQIFPYVKDKLNSSMINRLLDNTPQEQEYDMVKQIFPYVKDKLDSSMINRLLDNTPQEQEYDMVKQIFPYVKDKLNSDIINSLLYKLSKEQKYDMVKQIFPYVKDKLEWDVVRILLYFTPQEQKYDMVKQIFPYVKDKLDLDIINSLLTHTPQEHKQEIQSLIDKYKNNQSAINERMINKSKQNIDIINIITEELNNITNPNKSFNRNEYLRWKRNNVTLRGISGNVGEENNAGAMFGSGLYTAALSNKAMAKKYGQVYFVLNAIPKKPKVFNDTNMAEIFQQQLVTNFCKKHNVPRSNHFFSEKTTISDEMKNIGYDGLVIKGREMVNYSPPDNVKYFNNENQLIQYYEDFVK
jgi:hypothetical protein